MTAKAPAGPAAPSPHLPAGDAAPRPATSATDGPAATTATQPAEPGPCTLAGHATSPIAGPAVPRPTGAAWQIDAGPAAAAVTRPAAQGRVSHAGGGDWGLRRGAAGRAGWGALCVLAASVLWGTTGTAATFAPAVGPLAIGAAAMGLGGLLQALTAARSISRGRAALRAQRPLVLLGGLAVAVYPLAFYTSMRLAGVAAGTVVSIGSGPLASALAERILDKNRLTARWLAGAAVGLGGTALLCLAEAARPHPGHGSAGTTLLGVGLGLVAGTTYALYTWAAHRLIGRGVTSRAAMGAVFGLGGLLLIPVLFATGAPLVASWQGAAVGSYMAVVPMFTGYLLFGWALAHIPATTATTLTLLEPAVATLLAVTIVGEHLPAAGWAGLALIAACLVVLTAPRRMSSGRDRRARHLRGVSDRRLVVANSDRRRGPGLDVLGHLGVEGLDALQNGSDE